MRFAFPPYGLLGTITMNNNFGGVLNFDFSYEIELAVDYSIDDLTAEFAGSIADASIQDSVDVISNDAGESIER